MELPAPPPATLTSQHSALSSLHTSQVGNYYDWRLQSFTVIGKQWQSLVLLGPPPISHKNCHYKTLSTTQGRRRRHDRTEDTLQSIKKTIHSIGESDYPSWLLTWSRLRWLQCFTLIKMSQHKSSLQLGQVSLLSSLGIILRIPVLSTLPF